MLGLKLHSHLPKADTILKIFVTILSVGKSHPEKNAVDLTIANTCGLAVPSIASARTSEP